MIQIKLYAVKNDGTSSYQNLADSLTEDGSADPRVFQHPL